MRSTSFGRMKRLRMPAGLLAQAEVMQFDSSGRAHEHQVMEVAVCVSGSGAVVVGNECVRVEPGDDVRIPPQTRHYMIPDDGAPLCMMILYASPDAG